MLKAVTRSSAPAGDGALAELMSKIEERAFFERIGSRCGLHLASRDLPSPRAELDDATLAREGELLATEGFMHLARVAVEPRRLAGAIEELASAGVPPLFAYVFDEPWSLGAAVADAASRATSSRYELLADAWAFLVPPSAGSAGWPPHRGSYELGDRRSPDLLNVWVALTDATPDNACMYIVPLDADPSYPSDLRSLDAPLAAARALPATAGDALVWNANALHWGGRASARARSPRISVTFTLRRQGSPAAKGTRAVTLASLDHRARLDLLAAQIVAYGALDRSLGPEVHAWANLMKNLTNSSFRAR
jgi:hypothetical protein